MKRNTNFRSPYLVHDPKTANPFAQYNIGFEHALLNLCVLRTKSSMNTALDQRIQVNCLYDFLFFLDKIETLRL